MQPLDQIRTYWDRRARERTTDRERVDSTERSQRARFADVLRAIRGVRSVLDVGCGVGDLYEFLRLEDSRIAYRGVDLSEAMVARAREKYPEGHFAVANILEWADEPVADAVVAVGLHSLPIDGARSLLDTMLRKQFALSSDVVHANLLSRRYPHVAETQCWWPDEVLSMASAISPCVALHHDYLPHDFSVTLCRERWA